MAIKPLHILITDPHLNGGGQVRYVASLARELVANGHRVTIGCRPHSVLIGGAREAGAAVHDKFLLRGGGRIPAWARDVFEMRRFIKDKRPDIIHANGSQDHWVAAIANRSGRRSTCLVRTRHNTYKVKPSRVNRKLNRQWTDYQIVVCDLVRKQLAQQKTFDSRRLVTIHNGVDAEAFQPNEEYRQRARAEFGYTDDNVVCGIAARLVAAKGHEFLFKALSQIRESHSHLRVLVLGQGNLERSLKQMAVDLGIAEMVHFAGFRNDMAYCTQAFDIGCLPSVDCDTSSFSLKEEMAAEKPVIASDYGGLKEIVTDGVEGIIVPQGTVAPLATNLRRLADDPQIRHRMGVTGRKRVLREFTVEVFGQRTITAYVRALELHQREHSAS